MALAHVHLCCSKSPSGFVQQKLFNPYAGHGLTLGNASCMPDLLFLWEYAPLNLNFPNSKTFVGYGDLGIRAGRAAFVVHLAGKKLVADRGT